MNGRPPILRLFRSEAGVFVLAAALIVLSATLLLASTPPHWGVTFDPASQDWQMSIDCQSCHVGHQASGGTLTPTASNANLCSSCHNASGLAKELPVDSTLMSTPGLKGFHHAFGVNGVNAAAGAGTPSNPEMSVRMPSGRIICSTCHDQHANSGTNRGQPRISQPVKVQDSGGTGVLSSSGTYTGASGVWYLIEITTATKFQWSKDDGISWFGPTQLNQGSDVSLGNGVLVTFGAGTYLVGERWRFYASFPFLRAPLDDGDNATGDRFCRDCHSDWVMDSPNYASYTGAPMSHPVGVAIPVSSTYHSIPLDGDGSIQGGGGDGNDSNDLWLDGAGRLGCLTCHGIHYADSNTLTVDGP